MKNLFKKISVLAICLTALSASSIAQSTDNEEFKKDKKAFESSLTDEQKAVWKAQQQNRKATHKEFISTLNADQKAIMGDKSLSKEERKNHLRTTLSPAQLQMWENNKKQAQENKKALKNSLTKEQRKSFKAMHHHNNGKKLGHTKHDLIKK